MQFATSLLKHLHGPQAHDDLERYLGTFAGRLFERIDGGGDRPGVANNFTPADVVAIGTLSVTLSPAAIDQLLYGDVGQEAGRLLRAIPPDATIYEESAARIHSGPAQELWMVVRSLPGVGRTKTSKLLARKRPHLLPVVDSVVDRALGEPADFWRASLEAFREPEVRVAVAGLRAKAGVPFDVSDLRVADIVVWMDGMRTGARPHEAG